MGKLWVTLQEAGMPQHLIVLMPNLYWEPKRLGTERCSLGECDTRVHFTFLLVSSVSEHIMWQTYQIQRQGSENRWKKYQWLKICRQYRLIDRNDFDDSERKCPSRMAFEPWEVKHHDYRRNTQPSNRQWGHWHCERSPWFSPQFRWRFQPRNPGKLRLRGGAMGDLARSPRAKLCP